MNAALIAIALISGHPYPDQWKCGHDLAACPLSGSLLETRQFNRSLKQFTGNVRGSYIEKNALLYDQIFAALSGAMLPPIELRNGMRLFWSCVPHNCTEMGAVLLAPDGKILGAALLGVDWSPTHETYSLEVFLEERSPKHARWAAILRAWASRRVREKEDGDSEWDMFGPLGRIRVHGLAEQRGRLK